MFEKHKKRKHKEKQTKERVSAVGRGAMSKNKTKKRKEEWENFKLDWIMIKKEVVRFQKKIKKSKWYTALSL